MEVFIDNRQLRGRSQVCFATETCMWRLDRLQGPERALDAALEQFLDGESCNECLPDQQCGSDREYELVEESPTNRLVYTRRYEIDGCHTIPYFATRVLQDGAVFEVIRQEATYTWRVLFPDSAKAGELYDRMESQLSADVGVRLGQFSEPRGWKAELPALEELAPKQRAAIELAVDRGYDGTPRSVTLEELADIASVARSTLQYRLRTAEAEVLETAVEPR